MIANLQFHPPPDQIVDLLVIAGEASGDEHSALLMPELLKQNPNLKVSAIGGGEIEKEGVHLVYPLVDHAVVGLFEVLKNYSTFKQIFINTIEWIKTYKPKTILLVDFPGFNLRLASELKKLGISSKGGGSVKILQYISPQIWAWKPKRRFVMEKTLDGLGVIFPFEVACYKDTKLPVTFVGHPFAQPNYECSIKYDSQGPLLLLPGSRVQPVQRILPVFLDTLSKLLIDLPDLEVTLPFPDSRIRIVAENLISFRQDLKNKINLVEARNEISASAALMSSGTMSLSCAIAGIPGVIAYRAHPLTYLLGRMLVKVPHLGMANILLPSESPYPEFLQGKANGKLLHQSMVNIFNDNGVEEQSALVAQKLIECLKVSDESGVVEWLSQEISLA